MSTDRPKTLTASQSEWLRVICMCDSMGHRVDVAIIHNTPLRMLKKYGLVEVIEQDGVHRAAPTDAGRTVYWNEKHPND